MTAFRQQTREVLAQVDVDSAALKKLTNRDGETFEAWVKKHESERRRYEAAVLLGYPPPHQAAAMTQDWESWLAYAQQQRAVARAFRSRAMAVSRVILGKRGVKATESESEARTWEQSEEAERWEALCETIREWLWQARGDERTFQSISKPPKR